MKLITLLVVVVLLISCAEKQEMLSANEAAASEVSNNPSPAPGERNNMLVKKAELQFQVSDMKSTSDGIEKIVASFPAHIADSELSLNGAVLVNRMTIRVQSDYFDEFLKELDRRVDRVEHRKISSEDVTKQFVDLDSRLRTKREVQERLKDILRKNAGTIDELLAAENQIGDLQEEIESTVAKLNYMKDQVAYSTVYLVFRQDVQNVAAAEVPGIGMQLAEAFNEGLDLLKTLVLLITSIWPVALLLAGILFYARKKAKRVATTVRN